MKRRSRILIAVALSVLVVGADATRPPDDQLTAKGYLRSVDGYRRYVHPYTERYVRCRYIPTCSHYSQQAVQRFGIARGLSLTAKRLWSCRSNVPFGTYDAVPAR